MEGNVGDPESEFERFVAERGPALTRAARLMTGDWHAGADLAQETLIRLFRAWPRLRGIEAAESFARRVMVRLHGRQRRRRWTGEIPYADLPESPHPANAPGEDAELIAALQRLPVGQRQVLVLRYCLDLSVAATAEALGCSDGTVKSQSSKGLSRLRSELGRIERTEEAKTR